MSNFVHGKNNQTNNYVSKQLKVISVLKICFLSLKHGQVFGKGGTIFESHLYK